MSEAFEPTKVLITVMTYPHPSRGYQELVCTAGITESGEWVRLYPMDYRYRPREQQFHKYQWIEVGLAPHGHGNDNRKESRKPSLDSVRILGQPLSTADNWRERRAIVDRLPVYTVKQLQYLYEVERVSLILQPHLAFGCPPSPGPFPHTSGGKGSEALKSFPHLGGRI
jgi:hypothetical protein